MSRMATSDHERADGEDDLAAEVHLLLFRSRLVDVFLVEVRSEEGLRTGEAAAAGGHARHEDHEDEHDAAKAAAVDQLHDVGSRLRRHRQPAPSPRPEITEPPKTPPQRMGMGIQATTVPMI